MGIMVAIQKGNRVKAYDEDEKEVIDKPGTLYGYNDSYVSIKTSENKVEIYYKDGQYVTFRSL